MMVSPLDVFAQTQPKILLPKEVNGKVQLDISTMPNFNLELFRYEYLSVFVKNIEEDYSSNPVQGRYEVENDYLSFIPYFPFEKGMDYVVRTKHPYAESIYSYQTFQIGKKEVVEKAKLVSIYPTSDELPENLLRFYFYFNTPMKKEEALKHIQLIDEQGNVDNQAFMEFKQELWSADGKRLTLLFDPGRIKRGVSTNMELGPALLEGNKYQLTISGAWQDVYGQELSINTTKDFFVINPYRQQLKIDELEIRKPKANSQGTLSIHLARIIDHALVQSMIRIEDENNTFIPGIWETLEGEKIIRFIPEKTWNHGTYRIIMDSRLEDVAGNNLNNLLDQKAGKKNNDIKEQIKHFTI